MYEVEFGIVTFDISFQLPLWVKVKNYSVTPDCLESDWNQ